MAKYDAAGDKVQRRIPVAVWIMLLGVVVGVVGLIWCLNTDLKKYAKTENLYTDQNIDDVKNLDFEFDRSKVDIAPSDDRQIHVTIENAPKGMYTYGIKDNTFYIHKKEIFSIFRWSGITSIPFLKDVYPEAKITVRLPSIILDKVEIDSSISDVTFNTLTCETLDIDNGMGTLKLIDASAEKTTIDNGMGKIEVFNCVLGKSKIKNGMGKIKMDSCSLKGTDIDNGMGDVTITTELKGDMDIDNGMGDIDLKIYGDGGDYRITGDDDDVSVKGKTGSRSAEYKIHVDNGMGDVDIEFID